MPTRNNQTTTTTTKESKIRTYCIACAIAGGEIFTSWDHALQELNALLIGLMEPGEKEKYDELMNKYFLQELERLPTERDRLNAPAPHP